MTDALYLADLGADPRPGGLVELGGDEGRHAAVVKRTRVGEQLLVADGAGRAIRGPVIETDLDLTTGLRWDQAYYAAPRNAV